ncbi:MAG: hypothetical protein BGO12_11270 [Verrucomicrobia bacterium 61-8]|nr:hypothetical protein [Verrucomicrobiota bacterium]OJV25746.1 MAG: hypothetical protein BGO12_11270 [Verrucomicrobia bacterium 61-8]
MKAFGIRAIPGSRHTTWHAALYHGCSARADGQKETPFRDNQFRSPLTLVFNQQTRDRVIFPDKLCFPAAVCEQMKARADIELLPCVSQECFDVVVSPNSAWPMGADSSATDVELLSFVKKLRIPPQSPFSELVPLRLHLQPDANAPGNLKMTFRRYLHAPDTTTVSVNAARFQRMGIVYTEGWYWFTPEIWPLVSDLVDSSYFYTQCVTLEP